MSSSTAPMVTASSPAWSTQAQPEALCTVRALAPEALSAEDRQRWSALESHAIEPNAYASPHFVLPALRHLDPGSRSEVVFVERQDGPTPQTLGVATLTRRTANTLLPLPHTEVYQSLHSFCGAPLIAAGHAAAVWYGLLRHIRARTPWSFALVVRNLEQDGAAHAALKQACSTLGYTLHDSPAKQRAMLLPADTGAEALKRNLRKQHAEVERCKRRIAETGELAWQIHREAIAPGVTEDFLRLEHAGWKGEEGTSLRSQPAEEAFFKDMVDGFASEGRALFTELKLGAQTIASTSNLVSGTQGFAFKVGWDPAYRKNGVGILNEAELVRHFPQVCPDLTAFDSGAEPASFIEKLWPGRRPLVTSMVLFNAPARWSLRALGWVREQRARRAAAAAAPQQVEAKPEA